MSNNTQAFAAAYQQLNPEQKKAVDTIDGPLLVLAGPGTGKTQLLSVRVANILKRTDASPSNILCLTFTESAASNMRKRLRSLIGDAAYDVTISTYHSFGSDIIKSYSEYFQKISTDRTDDVRLVHPIDELSQIKIVEEVINQLPFDSLLLSARYYIKDVVGTINDLKKNLITPPKLKELALSNLAQIEQAQSIIDALINKPGGFSRKKDQLRSQYANLMGELTSISGGLVEAATSELKTATEESELINSTTPLTSWKNAWLHKDANDNFTLTKKETSQKMLDLAGVYEGYEQALAKDSLYDFNDMITSAIDGLSSSSELRFNLQERYQYILLDEFQDTNPSQFELVKLLCDHPVHEGRPNVMAVGDDDQAIFAFQGASIGNIQDFLNSFRDVRVINLVRNYRSHQDILHVAQNISTQIKDRIHHQIDGIDKILIESSPALPTQATVTRSELSSAAAEYSWVAGMIGQLLKSGVDPKEIAVIAPKHHLLENLVPFLHHQSIPLSYEKRENILDTEIIKIIRHSAELVHALYTNNPSKINEYFPLVLSHPYWGISAVDIWRLNWDFGKKDNTRSWAELALESSATSVAANYYLKLCGEVATKPLEYILDQLVTGTPLKSYYFGEDERGSNALLYYEAITHLSLIRSQLRDRQLSTNQELTLTDFLDLFTMYESAGEGLLNSHPISQGKNSVSLMTAYKAKGLEFDHVFILHAHDDIWGSTSRGSNNKLSLPKNLTHIRYAGSSDDERLRLFFVALTRARHGLYISSHTTTDVGKPTTPLKYLGEGNGLSPHLPPGSQTIRVVEPSTLELSESVATLWAAGRVTLPVNFRDLLADTLDTYVMSPTHLNTFMDLEHGGPEVFLVNTLLRFPSAPTVESEYGQAIHNTLEWYQQQLHSERSPSVADVVGHYQLALSRRHLSQIDKDNTLAKGELVLQKYLSSRVEMFKRVAKTEVNFANEGVVLGETRLTGKIDRLEIDSTNKTLRIVDFKTGSPVSSWGSSLKAYKYRHQLYFYKLLIEGSRSWRGYKVTEARLEFVEPASLRDGEIMSPLSIVFSDQEEAEIKSLIQVVWDKIQNLNLPKVTKYAKSLQGTKQFERDLLL